mmetsp:Transcript_18388/g.31722  ORF Transcript_18388/g.31722 Transcript_18388/m.31722 type:complete len:86 (+) Transcript_18388:848-1105(+)
MRCFVDKDTDGFHVVFMGYIGYSLCLFEIDGSRSFGPQNHTKVKLHRREKRLPGRYDIPSICLRGDSANLHSLQTGAVVASKKMT